MPRKEIYLNLDYPRFIQPALKDTSHFVVIPAGRQIGKTYNAGQWLIDETMKLGQQTLWVDTVHTNIDKYVERVFLPILTPIKEYCSWNSQRKVLKLPRGGIDFGSAQKPENLEGFNYPRAVLNEAGHILKKESLWYNTIKPMIKSETNQTKIIGCLTPNNYVFEKGKGIHKIGIFKEGYKESGGYLYGDEGYHKYIQKYGNGIYETIRIVDNFGYTIEGTPNHKVFTPDGWKRLDELKTKDRLYIQVGQNVYGHKKDDLWFCYFLGLYLAEGSIEEDIYRITITNQDSEIIDFLHNHGFKTCKDGIHHRINSKKFYKRWKKYFNKRLAPEKIIPNTILELNKECMCMFLSGYFDGDGHSDKNRARIGCNSSSRELIEAVHIILLNMGILSSTYKHITKPTKKVKKQCIGYRLEVNGSYATRLFFEQIGFRIQRKQDNIRNCVEDSSYTTWNIYNWSKELPSRYCSIRYNKEIKWNTLNKLGIYTDRVSSYVKKIEYSKDYTSDYVIPDTKQYCANGFISHNTPKGKNLFYKLYLLGLEGREGFKSYRYTVYDSPFWTPEQIQEVKGATPEAIFNQEYLASFEDFVGLIYPDFSMDKHIIAYPDRKITDLFFVGIDVGFNHPTGILLLKETDNHVLIVLDEIRESYLDPTQVSGSIKAILERNGVKKEDIQEFVIDPSARKTEQTSSMSMFDQLVELGWPLTPGNNDVLAGISRVTRLLREGKLLLTKKCSMLSGELTEYHWKEASEESDVSRNRPFKLKDDLADTLRYLCMARPDWFTKPSVDLYGRVIDDMEDLTAGNSEDSIMDIFEDTGDLIEDGGSIY